MLCDEYEYEYKICIVSCVDLKSVGTALFTGKSLRQVTPWSSLGSQRNVEKQELSDLNRDYLLPKHKTSQLNSEADET